MAELTQEQRDLQLERGTKQAIVLDQVMKALKLKNAGQLARKLEQQPAIISKLRKGVLALSPLYIIAIHELMENNGITGWSVREIKARLGLRRVGDPE